MPTINIQALSLGAQSANSFGADWTNPACTVVDNQDNWGRTLGAAEKFLRATSATEYLATTTADFLDVEVECWGRYIEVFFRLTADGKALRVTLNEDANLLVLHPLSDVLTPPGTYGGEGTQWTGLGASYTLTSLPGYVSTPAASRLWTLGVEGFDFYVELSGTEVIRIPQPYHVLTGKVAIRSVANDYGFANILVTALTTVSLFSDPPNAVFDPRDFGLKEVVTTGTITGGTATITVASATGFEIGDPIIVEPGGEAGGGLRGSKGVGGNFPPLSYATTVARDADTSQVDGKWCWVEDSGKMFYWDDGASQWKRGTLPDYYWAKALPYALTAEITNIVGNVLTLDTTANVTATNANVYHNNFPALTFFTSLGSYLWEPRTLDIPAGDYACGGVFNAVTGSDDGGLGVGSGLALEIRGQGIDSTRLYSPDGVPAIRVSFVSTDDCSVHDLELNGNFGDNGYRFRFVVGAGEDIGVGDPSWAYHQGVSFSVSNGGACYNVRAGDYPGACFESDHINTGTYANCEAFQSDPIRRYLANWAFIVSDSDATPAGAISFTDCTFTCPYHYNALETFRSNGVHFTRCHLTNGMASSNSSGSFLFDELTIIMEEGCANTSYVDAYGATQETIVPNQNPLLNINSNIQPPDSEMILGGVVLNPTIIVEGPPNTAGDSWSTCVVINSDNPNVQVVADPPWPERACDAPLTGGYISAPDYDPLATPPHYGASGVQSTGANTIVDGIRVVGTGSLPLYGNIFSGGANNDANTIFRNCVADDIVPFAATVVNNITNEEWAALCASNAPAATRVFLQPATSVVMRNTMRGY